MNVDHIKSFICVFISLKAFNTLFTWCHLQFRASSSCIFGNIHPITTSAQLVSVVRGYLCTVHKRCCDQVAVLSLQVLPDLYLGNFRGLSTFSLIVSNCLFWKNAGHSLSLLWICCVFARRKRPRTASQEQHHTHPVHSRQCSSDPPGEKRSSLPLIHLCPRWTLSQRFMCLMNISSALTVLIRPPATLWVLFIDCSWLYQTRTSLAGRSGMGSRRGSLIVPFFCANACQCSVCKQ